MLNFNGGHYGPVFLWSEASPLVPLEESHLHRLIACNFVWHILISVIGTVKLVPIWAELHDVALWPLKYAQ